jgi:ribonuclease HI
MHKFDKVIVYTDGASRGNPGRAAIAFMITKEDGKLLYEKGEAVGIDTNNVAEYRAILHALELAKHYTDGEVVCYSDSKLMINQLNGDFKAKKPHLKKLRDMVIERTMQFKKVTFLQVPREDKHITHVDMLGNMALDQNK